jgi:hypothetical protein
MRASTKLVYFAVEHFPISSGALMPEKCIFTPSNNGFAEGIRNRPDC